MRNWKLFGKIGAIALTALGLALVPGNFNVPGVGTVKAFAANAWEDATVTVSDVYFTGAAAEPNVTVKVAGTVVDSSEYTIDIVDKDGETESVNVGEKTVIVTNKDGKTQTADFEVLKCTETPEVSVKGTTAKWRSAGYTPVVTMKLGDVDLNVAEDGDIFYKWIDKDGESEGTEISDIGTYTLALMQSTAANNFTENALAGLDEITYVITGFDINDATITGLSSKVWYVTNEDLGFSTNDGFTNLKIVANGVELVKGTDYEVEYNNGAAIAEDSDNTLVITGNEEKGYTGTYTYVFHTTGANLTKYGAMTLKNSEVTYTGEATIDTTDDASIAENVKEITLNGSGLPTLTISGSSNLAAATDFGAFSSGGYTNVGTVKITAVGADPYEGSVEAEYKIAQADIDEIASWSVATIPDQSYNGDAIEVDNLKTAGGNNNLNLAISNKNTKQALNQTDYTYSYENNTNVGTATITATGKNNLTGTKTITFKIKAIELPANLTIKKIEDQSYTGSAIKPTGLTVLNGTTQLVEDTDYTLSYKNNVEVGVATVVISGAGNYTGDYAGSPTFNIVEADLEKYATASADGQVYTGSAIEPVKVIQTADNKELTKGTDYTVEYTDNVEVGTASYVVTGKGNYTGTLKGEFTISNDFSGATIAAIKAVTYNGKAQEPAVTVTIGETTLKSGTDYTVAYKNNKNAGTATVTVTPAGSYSGDAKTATFKINKASVKAKITKITGTKTVGAGKKVTLKAVL
ncbi:MAG: hypothetical protein IJT96_01905, partial [Lachnospiraceae bacterium]|nr:hypothetical protein [Lachnospiraceae bacterium]